MSVLRDRFGPDHPTASLGAADDRFAQVEVEISSSTPSSMPECESLMFWGASASVSSAEDATFGAQFAHMSLTVVDPTAADPVDDLDAVGGDNYMLGQALWDRDGERTFLFEDAVVDQGGPVLLIDTFTVEPDWRGTPLTPIVAARVLAMFAQIGVGVAALYASPMASGLSDEETERISRRIVAMWERIGFERLKRGSKVMVLALDRKELAHVLEKLADDDEGLREAAGLWG